MAAPLTLERLRVAVAEHDIDTVVVAITDMQGRLQGKRFYAPHFIDEVAQHGTEGCNYLLAVDVEMNTVDGYAMSSWARGDSGLEINPDLENLRMGPWWDGPAMHLGDP